MPSLTRVRNSWLFLFLFYAVSFAAAMYVIKSFENAVIDGLLFAALMLCFTRVRMWVRGRRLRLRSS